MRVATPVLLALLLASAAVAVTTVTVERPPGARDPAPPALAPQSQPLPPPSTTAEAAPRTYPRLPQDPAAIAAELAALEPALRSTAPSPDQLPELAHRQQVIYRRLATDPALAARVRVFLPVRWQGILDRHLAARREFLAMHRGGPRSAVVPAWRIIPPEPAANLLRYYREAAAATGIPWEVLAAVNLVETGMGRIDGVSVADARGPMQFLPSTWAQRGIGQGDIRDPEDAIHAAARYLVRRGGSRTSAGGSGDTTTATAMCAAFCITPSCSARTPRRSQASTTGRSTTTPPPVTSGCRWGTTSPDPCRSPPT
jgi:hypothetical protein